MVRLKKGMAESELIAWLIAIGLLLALLMLIFAFSNEGFDGIVNFFGGGMGRR